jgi:hypothetical protein
VFESGKGEVTEEWKTLHKEEPHGLFSSSSIIIIIESSRMTWVGHVANWGGIRYPISYWQESQR